MFEAWILVCLASNPSECFEAQDGRGPYPTKQQCVARTQEMIQDTNGLIPFQLVFKWRCSPPEGIQT